MSDLEKWLDTVQCTDPFTIDDCRALQTMIKQRAGVKGAEVYTSRGRDGYRVHVAVDVDGQRIRRTYNVTG